MTQADEQIGMAWWNELTRQERMTVLIKAGRHFKDPSVADAYMLWRQGIISTEPNEQEGDEKVI